MQHAKQSNSNYKTVNAQHTDPEVSAAQWQCRHITLTSQHVLVERLSALHTPVQPGVANTSSYVTLLIHGKGFAVLTSSAYLFTAGVRDFVFYLIIHRHTPQSVGFLWTRDRPLAETST
jgi:hypothetical protein